MSDEIRALVDTEAQKRHDLEEILAEARRRLHDHSSFLRSYHELFSYNVGQALKENLRPFYGAVGKFSVALPSVLANGEKLRQSVRSIISSLDRRFS